jgi:hypothetical protein
MVWALGLIFEKGARRRDMETINGRLPSHAGLRRRIGTLSHTRGKRGAVAGKGTGTT